jgi:hypothetical protein
MRVIVRKALTLIKFLPVGQVMEITHDLYEEIKDNVEEYKGEYPPNPKRKHKMNLSQLKK